MKPKKKVFIITSLVMVVILLALQPILAWFYQYRTNLLLITGDIELSVKGWSQVANDETILSYPNALQKINSFNYKDVSVDNFIAFKFEVTNKKEKDALLSVRFSDFSEYIFEYFSAYRNQMTVNGHINEILRNNIYANAESNTAKIATIIDMVYYYDVDGIKVELNFENQYTWLYSAGKKIFEGINLPGVRTDTLTNQKIESSVELFFALRSSNDSNSIEEYKKWLLGYVDEDEEHHIGYGQNYLAFSLGYTWEVLPDTEKDMIDSYLNYFLDCEFDSVRTIGAEGLALINFNLQYFEFIGDSVRP